MNPLLALLLGTALGPIDLHESGADQPATLSDLRVLYQQSERLVDFRDVKSDEPFCLYAVIRLDQVGADPLEQDLGQCTRAGAYRVTYVIDYSRSDQLGFKMALSQSGSVGSTLPGVGNVTGWGGNTGDGQVAINETPQLLSYWSLLTESGEKHRLEISAYVTPNPENRNGTAP